MSLFTARDFMATDVITVSPKADVLDATRLLLRHRISGAPVVDREHRYLGVYSDKCSMHVLLDAVYEQLPVREVRAFMDVDAQTIGSETHLLSVAQVFLLTPYRLLPVLEEGRLVGLVTCRDVMKHWMELVEQTPGDSREKMLMYFSALFELQETPLA